MKLRYRHLKGYKYETMSRYEFWLPKLLPPATSDYVWIDNYQDESFVTIKKRYAWDGASGIFTIDTKTFMRGSLVHDAFYQLIREGCLNRKYRKYVDQLLKKICLEDGMNKFRAWYVYKAVRIFGKKSSMPRKNPRGKLVEL